MNLHPHDDEEDPKANECNYNFPQVIFAFLLGIVTMFLLSIDEIQKFKGCPFVDTTTNTVQSSL
jgi:hypothetical protein